MLRHPPPSSPRLRTAVLALFLTATLSAQDLVTNGDFAAGSAGWTISGYAVQPRLVNFDVAGSGATPAFSCRPGCGRGSTPPNCPALALTQSVQLLPNVPHLLVADLAVENNQRFGNVDGGTITLVVDGSRLKTVKFGAIAPNTVERRQVCIRFAPTTAGSKNLQIQFTRSWRAQAATPRNFVDNIRLLRAPARPLICARGERKVSGSLTLDVYGTAAARYGLFISLAPLAPVAIPGFNGRWALGLPNSHVLSANLDATGTHQLVIPLATAGSAAGIPLFWQAIELSSNGASIGERASFGIYR